MSAIELHPYRPVRGSGLGRRLCNLVMMSRPQFWLLSVVAIGLGFVLATRRIVPRGPEIATMANAVLVTGPLLWLAVLSINDAYDLDTDRINARKACSPLVAGRVTPYEATRIGVVAGVLAVLAALPLGGLFAVGTAAVVLLGFAYSAPPLRLKARAGADTVTS